MKTMIGSNVSAEQLRSVVERIERLEEQKAGIGADIKEVYAEAHGNGLCRKAIRQIVKLRKKDANERQEEEAMLTTYMRSLGMLPLFEEE
ncbi:MAG TPA: DUF2312 domain-containing protein [Gemmataceae bacterium]|nr:DUF2312 domain-containing protein [Gemmataceae bacterium]